MALFLGPLYPISSSTRAARRPIHPAVRRPELRRPVPLGSAGLSGRIPFISARGDDLRVGDDQPELTETPRVAGFAFFWRIRAGLLRRAVTLHGELASDLIAIVRAESRTWAIDVGEIRTTGSPAAIKSRSIRRVMCRQSSIAHNRCSPSLAQLVGIGAALAVIRAAAPPVRCLCRCP